MSKTAITLLRLSLAVTYLWFGALKVVGKSPIADLVAETVFFIPRKIVVPLMGLWEIAIGIGLLLRFPLRLTLFAYFAHIAGTFMTLFIRPDETFQKENNPLLLTERGEFIVKNLVLASAGLAVASAERGSEDKSSLPG